LKYHKEKVEELKQRILKSPLVDHLNLVDDINRDAQSVLGKKKNAKDKQSTDKTNPNPIYVGARVATLPEVRDGHYHMTMGGHLLGRDEVHYYKTEFKHPGEQDFYNMWDHTITYYDFSVLGPRKLQLLMNYLIAKCREEVARWLLTGFCFGL